ncbi:MAG: hypothetical protein LQ347_003004 [Umbilicaria vellea]|nr:MAG: hypothetical protein LQ347_003004 [Umbilicaria vellea]
MVMALGMVAESSRLQVTAGYESGHTMVFVQGDPGAPWQTVYVAQPHTQPVLSLAISPSQDYYITSSADAIIAKHPLPSARSIWNSGMKPLKVLQTKHSGRQGLHIRSDGKIFSTAGWDARVRIHSAKTLTELAVLKWHKEGCYATAFAEIDPSVAGSAPQEMQTSTPSSEGAVTRQTSSMNIVQQRRNEKAQSTHWLAAGSKDGKVSLWDIY